MIQSPFLRRVFRLLNKFLMVPLFRLGLGALVGNPLTGYIMVVKTTGRRTGRVRHTPVNYAILDGQVYCLAGFGEASDWVRNARAHPAVELLLPGGALAGLVEEVSDPGEAAPAQRAILKASGFAGLAAGLDPRTLTDEALAEKLEGCPVLRIRAAGPGSGAGDPGGWLWLLAWIVTGLVIAVALLRC